MQNLAVLHIGLGCDKINSYTYANVICKKGGEYAEKL